MRLLLLLTLVLAASPLRARAQEPFGHLAGPRAPAAVDGNIYNGTPTSDFPAVVGLVISNRNGTRLICTGTVIAPSAVLTAAHCLAFDPIAATAVVFPDRDTRAEYEATALVPHPRFKLARAAVADIGIIVLEGAIADVAPSPLAERSPRPGTTGTIVGFGDDGTGDGGLKRVGTVRLRRCPRVVRVRNGKVRLGKSLCWRPMGQDTCSGDSGGPLIVDGRVAGVTSGGIGTVNCPSQLSYDTNVVRYRAWIRSVIQR